jgi:hypothetical protein
MLKGRCKSIGIYINPKGGNFHEKVDYLGGAALPAADGLHPSRTPGAVE